MEAKIPVEEDVIVEEFEDALPHLQDWLRLTAEADADEGCRQLAAACHAIFGKAVREELRLDVDSVLDQGKLGKHVARRMARGRTDRHEQSQHGAGCQN